MAAQPLTPAQFRDLEAIEHQWLTGHLELRCQPQYWGWEPYGLPGFTRLLAAAMDACPVPGPLLVEVGAGIGTKILTAQRMGCRATGIERVPEYVEQARRLGAGVTLGDARDYDYSAADIVYVNHPFRGAAEPRFERWLHSQIRPGGVLIAVNMTGVPDGWAVVVAEDATVRCGVYVKPSDPLKETV